MALHVTTYRRHLRRECWTRFASTQWNGQRISREGTVLGRVGTVLLPDVRFRIATGNRGSVCPRSARFDKGQIGRCSRIGYRHCLNWPPRTEKKIGEICEAVVGEPKV